MFIVGILSSRQTFYLVNDAFKPGFLIVEDHECRSSQGPSYCSGFGSVIDLKGNIVQVNKSLGLGYSKEIDWAKKKYAVFYRESGRFPVSRDPHEMILDKQNHIWHLFLSFFGAIVVPILSFLGYTRFNNNKEEDKKPVASPS